MAEIFKLLNQQEAIELDQELFNEYGFSVNQLMELAGLSVAQSIAKSYPLADQNNKTPIVCCGPGNNGGDGLVAARHLKLFGYSPIIIYPKEPKQDLYNQLLKQCRGFDIKILDTVPDEPLRNIGGLVVDCVFGFSFKPPNRNEIYAKLLKKIDESCRPDDAIEGKQSEERQTPVIPLISVDIPSGWHVEKGPETIEASQAELDQSLKIPVLKPDCLISLTAPKLCSSSFKGQFHYLAGRFCPDKLLQKYNLTLPVYPSTEGFVLLNQQTKQAPVQFIRNQTTTIARNVLSKLKALGL